MANHSAGESSVTDSDSGALEPHRAACETADGLLDQLKCRESSREAHLEQRVESAILPFKQVVAAEQLEFMRRTLRAQLESEPLFAELARRATDMSNGR